MHNRDLNCMVSAGYRYEWAPVDTNETSGFLLRSLVKMQSCICICMLRGSTHYCAIAPRVLSLGSRWMETAPTSIEVLLRPTLVQTDEPSELRGSLSPTTRPSSPHVLVYTAPGTGSPRRSPIQLWTGPGVAQLQGGEGCHLRVVPPGQLLRRPSTPKPSSNQVLLFFWHDVFCVCFPVVFALRLLCLFLNSFQFKFFIYSLYIHIYIFYIFFHCTCGALQCSHGLWSLWRASSRWQTRSPAVGALLGYS